MPTTYKFPHGYDILVYDREDIIECLDKNVTDKEVVLELINQLMIDAKQFIADGVWTGIPYLGSIRKDELREELKSEEIQNKIKEAKEVLPSTEFRKFRINIQKHLASKRYKNEKFKITVSKFQLQNKELYREYLKEGKELNDKNYILRAKLKAYFMSYLKPCIESDEKK